MKIKAILLAGLTLSISGCYLGNFVIPGTASQDSGSNSSTSSDPLSGYYLATPKSLKFYATLTTTIEKDASTSLIPSLLSQHITNPVAFILQDAKSGLAGLWSPTDSDGLPIYIDSQNHLSYSTTTTPRTFWLDPNCKKYVELNEDGNLIQNPSMTNTVGTHLPLSGGIQLTVQVITQFQGDCTATFQAVYQCYLDSNQCAGNNATENLDLQASVVQMFAPWVQSQALLVSDIPNLKNLAYEATYE